MKMKRKLSANVMEPYLAQRFPVDVLPYRGVEAGVQGERHASDLKSE